jgi:DNA mismatch repair ATPase MutS
MNQTIFKLIDWNELKNMLKQNYSIEFIKLDSLYNSNSKWIRNDELEELNDIEILSELKKLHEMNGTLYIISDVSYRADLGPFIVDSNCVNEFVEKHLDFFGERFWDTDTIIISFENNVMWFVQHDNYLGLCCR